MQQYFLFISDENTGEFKSNGLKGEGGGLGRSTILI